MFIVLVQFAGTVMWFHWQMLMSVYNLINVYCFKLAVQIMVYAVGISSTWPSV